MARKGNRKKKRLVGIPKNKVKKFADACAKFGRAEAHLIDATLPAEERLLAYEVMRQTAEYVASKGVNALQKTFAKLYKTMDPLDEVLEESEMVGSSIRAAMDVDGLYDWRIKASNIPELNLSPQLKKGQGRYGSR